MNPRTTLALLLALAVGLAAASEGSRVARPVIAIDKPGKCVEPTETMRRDHMRFLMHQRDRTMRDGVRTRTHSLAGCVECHANSKTGSVLGEGGFCQGCHAYAGVHLDCFECHASRPALARAGAKR